MNEIQEEIVEQLSRELITIKSGKSLKAPCNEGFIPLFQEFRKKILETPINIDSFQLRTNIDYFLLIPVLLAKNTRNYEDFSSEDLLSLQKIFGELYSLYDEILLERTEENQIKFREKIIAIYELVRTNAVHMTDRREKHAKNWRDGMIFQSYENLWKVMKRLNREWDELCLRGFSTEEVLYPFEESFVYSREIHEEMSEEDKLQTFMDILDGIKKFIPVYVHEYRLIGFKPVDLDDDTVEVVTEDNEKGEPSHGMRQVGEETPSTN